MSTIGVFDGIEDPSHAYIAQEERLPPGVDPNRMANAYFQSKWVSERLVWNAADRGLRVSIFRIGQVGASVVTGMVNRNDALAGFIVSCKKLGFFPASDLRLPFVDADATKAIVHFSALAREEGDANGRVYHIVGREVGLDDFFRGKPIKECELGAWEAEFQKLFVDGPKSQDDINAWLFLQMLQQAETQVGSNHLRLMKNISFSTDKIKQAAGILFPREPHPSLYADLLMRSPFSN